MTNWSKNCEKLKDYLHMKIGKVMSVKHQTIGDVDYFYVILFGSNCSSELQISGALNISKKYVRMIGYDKCDNQIDLVEADAVFDKWGNPLCFNDDWLFRHLGDGRLPSVIRSRLYDYAYENDGVFRDITSDILFIKVPCTSENSLKRLCKILGIKDYYVGILFDNKTDYWDSSGWIYIDLNKVKDNG